MQILIKINFVFIFGGFLLIFLRPRTFFATGLRILAALQDEVALILLRLQFHGLYFDKDGVVYVYGLREGVM